MFYNCLSFDLWLKVYHRLFALFIQGDKLFLPVGRKFIGTGGKVGAERAGNRNKTTFPKISFLHRLVGGQ